MAALKALSSAFEIDFVALTYTCDGGDIQDLRELLDDIGLASVKIIAKVGMFAGYVADVWRS